MRLSSLSEKQYIELVFDLRKNADSFAALGRKYSITRERVRQIARQEGFSHNRKTRFSISGVDKKVCPTCGQRVH